MKKTVILPVVALLGAISTPFAVAKEMAPSTLVSDQVVEDQRAALAKNTEGKGFGPQSPRDIDVIEGQNQRIFSEAPEYQKMNLCNIHFHKNAEHKGGEFTVYAGNGDGKGYGTGYKYSGKLSKKELEPKTVGDLSTGDTIEVHYVHTSAKVMPGPTLGACLADSTMNPQLRVETVVVVLVSDPKAMNFVDLTKIGTKDGYAQALNIPKNLGKPVRYAGSTTGPKFNEQGSPLQVSWSVRPKVAKVNIDSVGKWYANNIFDETKAHGVRNLVINPALLSGPNF